MRAHKRPPNPDLGDLEKISKERKGKERQMWKLEVIWKRLRLFDVSPLLIQQIIIRQSFPAEISWELHASYVIF